MFVLHHFFVVAALSGAVFPLPSQAGELEEYEALKSALVRSTSKKTPDLPIWIKVRAKEFEPRPHYWLDLQPRDNRSAPLPEPVKNDTPAAR